jgi:hypothetical protein
MAEIEFETSATTTQTDLQSERLEEPRPVFSTTQTLEEESLDAESTLSLSQKTRKALQPLRRRFRNEFSQLLRESEFEYGFSSPAEKYVSEELLKHGPLAREWINELFLEDFTEPHILGGVLRVISHFDYSELHPQGMTMCVAALSHADPAIKEEAIRVIENWENADLIPLLRSLDVRDSWLVEYINQVIRDLEADR